MNAKAFDHSHQPWDALLQAHVQWLPGNHSSAVDYAAFQANEKSLNDYLSTLSAVTPEAFARWTQDQQLSFLINAYNAFTVSLVLTRYPKLVSIKDIGSLFKSAWKRPFFELLGEQRHLDNVEHDMIREPGRYDDPRIHFAVNCASVGCPALRNEAYVAERLDQQLDDQVRRFVSDTSRNYPEASRSIAHISPIFDWYEEDFSLGELTSVVDFLRAYGDDLEPSMREIIDADRPRIRYSDYDWSLNDLTRDQ